MLTSFNDILKSTESQVSQIPIISDSTNFWMVRSKKGVFFDEFLRNNYIAIGWNILTETTLSEHEDDYLKSYLTLTQYKDKMPGTAVNKCRRFVDELKENDIAMIVGKDEVAFALIGEYYEHDDNHTTVEKELDIIAQIDSGTYYGFPCPYRKRRRITVIARSRIDLVSPAIYKCLVSNRHSLSNLNDYADPIISSCYDVAFYDNRLIVKYHIGQPRDINPFNFSLFTYNVVKLLAEDSSPITGKYNINSEGDVVLFLYNTGKDIYEFIRDNIATIWVIYAILFGGKGLGFEIPSAVDKIKGWVSDILYQRELKQLKQAEANKIGAETEKMQADAKKAQAETELIQIEASLKKEELERIRTQKASEASLLVDELQKAAEPLNISPPDPHVINLVTVLNSKIEINN